MINISVYKKCYPKSKNCFDCNECKDNQQIIESFNYMKNKHLPYTTNYIDFIIRDNYYIFVSEKYGNSLDSLLKNNPSFSISQAIKITYQLLRCITHLEKENIYLRYLTPKSIEIDDKDNIKVNDYLVDKIFHNKEINLVNNIKYLAPELIFYKENEQVASSVIFSIGIIILELLCDKHKFSTYNTLIDFFDSNDYINSYLDLLKKYHNDSFINKKVMNDSIDYKTDNKALLFEYFLNGEMLIEKDNDLVDFIYECLVVNCDKRKTASQLIQHPFFKTNNIDDVKWNFTILPIDKERLIAKEKGVINVSYLKKPSSKDNYEILTNICSIDIVDYLYRLQCIEYFPLINSIPELLTICNDKQEQDCIIERVTKIDLSFPNDYNNPIDFFTQYMISEDNQKVYDKEIQSYFKLKLLLGNYLYQLSSSNEELLLEIKKKECLPSSLRLITYCYLLGIDYYNDRDNLSLISSFKLNNYIKDNTVNKILNALFINNKNLFFISGMELLASSVYYSLSQYDEEISYMLMEKIITKLYIQLSNEKDRTYRDLKFNHLIIERMLLYQDPKYYIYLSNENVFKEPFLKQTILSLFSINFKGENLLKIIDAILINNLNLFYIIITNIFLMYKMSFTIQKQKDIYARFDTLFDQIDIDRLLSNSISIYKKTPQSFLPIYHEYNEEAIAELAQNEFFKNRWWDMRNFYTDDIKAPVIVIDDIIKYYNEILFVDIRKENKTKKVKQSIDFYEGMNSNADDDEEKYSVALEKINQNKDKIIVLLGDKDSVYKDIIIILSNQNIKNVCVLQGGIDIIQLDEPSLLQ